MKLFETSADYLLAALIGLSVYLAKELRTQCRIMKALVTIAKIRHPKEAEQVGL